MKHNYLLTLILVTGIAMAGQDLDKQAFQFSEFNGDIAAQVNVARAKIDQVEYKEMSSNSRQSLTDYFAVLQDAASSKQQASEAQANANTILAKAFSDSKLVCSYETQMGTNMKKRVCLTAAAKKRIYERTQTDLENRPVRDVAKIAN